MEKVTDWLLFWEQLVAAQDKFWHHKKEKKQKRDFWKDRARDFDKMVKKRWSVPDTSRNFVLSKLKTKEAPTIVDIGAGTGAWALLMSRHAAKVTAVEPSDAMCEVMEEKLAAENITNVEIVRENWQDVTLEPHDFTFASHSMYGVPDFKGFVEKMMQVSQTACFLLMRVLFSESVMAKAARHVWGQPYDSPNFQVAYNALMQMDIYPDVIMETEGAWDPWTHDTIEDALTEVKSRLGIDDKNTHDDFLQSLLERSLKEEDGKYVWPVGNRSGIVYWETINEM